jgi:periplasmic divalent cation tolerance protein
MFNQSNEALEQLQKLREKFTAILPEKLQVIDVLWQTVKQHGVGNSEHTEELTRAVHSLAGSAGTFGHKQLGDVARQLEQILQQNLSNGEPLSDLTIRSIETELHRLREC